MKYYNHEQLTQAGIDPTPKHGDVVEWVNTKTRWRVSKRQDLEGSAALHHWPDGGWCHVRLVSRKEIF